jgi:hypothetical protein
LDKLIKKYDNFILKEQKIGLFKYYNEKFGIKYYKIEKNIELDIIKNILEEECPIICEVFTYPNEPFEPKVIAKGIDSNGKIIAGDLSDSYISETF